MGLGCKQDVNNWEELYSFYDQHTIRDVVFSLDGDRIAAAIDDVVQGNAKVWQLSSGEAKVTLPHQEPVKAVAFSPDGLSLATGTEYEIFEDAEGTARVWDMNNNEQLAFFEHQSTVNAIAFSPKGTLLATVSEDGKGRIWDLTTKKELVNFRHNKSVLDVAFSVDGNLLATASEDNTARVWNAVTGHELARIPHARRVNAVTFSPDGTQLATGSDDHTVRVWPWRANDLIQIGCSVLSRNLTQNEWQEYLGDEPYQRTCLNLPDPKENSNTAP